VVALASTTAMRPVSSSARGAKKRRPLSSEARAKLAQNLVKPRAARAAKHKGSKRTATKTARTVKKTRRAAKKR
jgi:hypothetical protein